MREKGKTLTAEMSNLFQDVFAGSAQDDGAGLGILALHQVGEILISVFANLKEATLGSHITLFQLVCSIAHCCSAGPGQREGS